MRPRRCIFSVHQCRNALLFAGGLLAAIAMPLAAADSVAAPMAPAEQQLSISNVGGRYINATQFHRISEFFTGRENKSGRVIERSQPEERSGYYVIVNLNLFSTPLPADGAALLEYIHSDDRKPHSKLYPIPSENGRASEAFFGITGADWPSTDRKMVAWRLTLLDSKGNVVATEQSYLWDLPPPETDTRPDRD